MLKAHLGHVTLYGVSRSNPAFWTRSQFAMLTPAYAYTMNELTLLFR